MPPTDLHLGYNPFFTYSLHTGTTAHIGGSRLSLEQSLLSKTHNMSGRSRGRGNPNQDADEERRLWKEIKDKAKDVDTMVVSDI